MTMDKIHESEIWESPIEGLSDEELERREARRNRELKASNLALTGALKLLLAWANIQDFHSPQAVFIRDAALAAIKEAEQL
jgi:hypothetical protein